ncbi:four helix bundle protein [Candidatus Parcubacteria bacterium]|nr:four helix bundle protein [Candidatus Parcubacteria bacterium]
MITKNFEDIIPWKKSQKLSVSLYKIFRDNRDFGFRDQIQRASVSISNNIAEGFDRRGNKEFKQFLYIAKGSCSEVRSMLYIALELEYLSKSEFNEFYNLTVEISKLIQGFINSLK